MRARAVHTPTSTAPSNILRLQLLEWSALTDLLMHARTCRDSGEGEVIIDTVPAIWPVGAPGGMGPLIAAGRIKSDLTVLEPKALQ